MMIKSKPPFRDGSILLVIFAILSWGCDNGIRIQNVAPAVTAVGPVSLLEDDTVRLFVWLRDHEEDPVDITVFSVGDDESETELNIVGGHLTTGLTTSKDPAGQVHELIWAPADIPTGTVQLRVRAVDWNGGEGPPYTTSAFVLSDGLPAP